MLKRPHKYKLLYEDEQGIDEVCIRCGKRLTTPKGFKGVIHNETYLKEHELDFMQKSDPRFEIEYGKVETSNTKTTK